jgi:FixJ family two-component response regulator
MPGMNGIELQAHLLAQGIRLPFIFITAYPDELVRVGDYATVGRNVISIADADAF